MKKLVQINPVVRINTSTGRIMQEIGELAIEAGWDSYIAYSGGRDGVAKIGSHALPVGRKRDVALHGIITRLTDRHGLCSKRATKQFVAQLEELQPDVVHIHNIHGYFLNYKILFDYLRSSGVPVIWTVHDCWLYTGHCYYYSYINCEKWQSGCNNCPQRHKFPASWIVDRSHQNFIDKREAFTSLAPGQLTIVPVSDWIRDEMKKSFLADCNFRVIHNGINTEVFKPCDNHSEIRRRYALEGKKVYLGVASIWSEEKGLNDLIKMAEMTHKDETVALVGVTEKIKRKLPGNMVGITRTDNIGQLAQLYSLAEAFVNPTWQDNYPTVNMEAIACGTPVATYRTGGSIETITPDTGLIVEQGDVEGLLKAARELGDGDKASRRRACREYALSNFRKEDRYRDYLKLYDEIRGA